MFSRTTTPVGFRLAQRVLAAVFLGKTAVRPGQANVMGTVIGVFFVVFTVSGLSIAGAQAWVGPVFNGAALVGAIALSTVFGRQRKEG